MLQDIINTAIQFRRDLHQKPELSWQEHATAATIRHALSELDIPWRACADTGTLAYFGSALSGLHIALRGDIDALPLVEKSGKAWASKTKGCMHACGHDGHTATLIATAHWLKLHESQLAGPVTLVFQPAEEGGHGALKMIEDGALKGVNEIYGWHNWPAVPYGQALCPDGTVMSANSTFAIKVDGKGGHASQPEACHDPVLAASAINLAAQQIVSRRLPPQQAGVVSITSINALSGNTIIPGHVDMAGGIRGVTTETRDFLAAELSEVVSQTAASYGCKATTIDTPCYGATRNHSAQASKYRQSLNDEFGDNWLCQNVATPIMASEDFSYFLNEIPGAFALIGADDGEGHCDPCHSAHYDFNDKLIARVLPVYARLVGLPYS
ncbi:MAG: peptidase M20 [Alteromonadaceae bacterium]|nr:MAG: peptidase M20 [Alteromonadaceae bacterium]